MKEIKNFIGDDGVSYATKEEAIKADEAFAKKKSDEEAKKNAVSKQKKELANKVDLAESEVKEAYKQYGIAKKKAAEILEKSNAEAEKVLKEALTAVDKANEKRMLAIKEFNDRFGIYTKTYSGEEAIDEYERLVNSIMSKPLFTNLFDILF